MNYPKTHQSFFNLLLSTLKLYPASFISILPFSLLAGLAAALYIELVKIAEGGWLAVAAFAIIALLQVYFFACGLKRMDARLLHEKSTLRELSLETFKQIGLIYAGFFLSIIIFSFTFGLGYFFVKIISSLVPGNEKLVDVVMLAFIGMPLLFISVWLMLFVPQLIIYKRQLSVTLAQSFKLVGFKNWSVVFYLYVLVSLLVYFSAPGSLHMQWLNDHYLVWPFNIILYILWLPLIVNYTLLLMNRLKLRVA